MATHDAQLHRPEMLVFDVNETLLDLGILKPDFVEIFGSPDLIGEWFARMLHGSLVANATAHYRPFLGIGAETLLVVAQRHGVELSADRAVQIVTKMRTAPPHADVVPGLQKLSEAGVRMMALSNGSYETLHTQLESSGIGRFFEGPMSADDVRRFKPAPEVYLMAAAAHDVDIDKMMMVASHDWDLAGGRSVGMQTAFIDRPGVVWGPGFSAPDVIAPTIDALADRIIALPAG